jgi:hypothetical protein
LAGETEGETERERESQKCTEGAMVRSEGLRHKNKKRKRKTYQGIEVKKRDGRGKNRVTQRPRG